MDDIKKMMEQCLKMSWDAVTDANLEAMEEGRVVSLAEWDEIMVNTLIANGVTIPVRCKYCKKRYKPNECPMCILVYGEQHDFTQENGYCDRGERRTDDRETG